MIVYIYENSHKIDVWTSVVSVAKQNAFWCLPMYIIKYIINKIHEEEYISWISDKSDMYKAHNMARVCCIQINNI